MEINTIKCKKLKSKSLSCELLKNDLLVGKVEYVELIHCPTEVKSEHKLVSDGFETEIHKDKGLHCQIIKQKNSNQIFCK